MGKGAGSQKQKVAEYRLSYHCGLAAELDAVTAIYVGEKEAWTGDVTAEAAISVNRPDLFGGPKKEGGVAGIAYYLPGGPTQKLPAGLAARRGLTSDTHPAYRGIASVYFVGTMEPGNGFMWGATPYMQSIWIRGRRAPKGLSPTYAMIGQSSSVIFDGLEVDVNGTKATLQNGVASFVNGRSVKLTFDAQLGTSTFVIDGTTILFDEDEDDRPQVSVNGTTRRFDLGTITISGVTIVSGGGVTQFITGTAGQDANPAHIIYECLTNTAWGMGAPGSVVDKANFEAVAVTLFNEGFGLSMIWNQQTTIQAFITEIVDHIQGVLYVDPATGKFTLKLLRDDYDATTLPTISPDNADLSEFQRKLWGETINEVVGTWTNPVNEQEETVTAQDLANITLQGGVVSDSRNYYAVRNSELATRLVERDVVQSGAPLASANARLDRTQWNLRPGSVVRLIWPEYDIESVICRVTNIDYGKIGSPEIVVALLEDIFSIDMAAAVTAPSTGWIDPSEEPAPLDRVRVITAPAYLTTRRLTAADSESLAYPEVLVNILAATSQRDAAFYQLMGQTTLPNGDTVAEDVGTRPLLGVTQMTTALAAEATSVIPAFPEVVGNQGPTVSGFLFIGNVSERIQEIALIESFSEAGWMLKRGVLDTIPRAWPIGTTIWFFDIRNDIFDPDVHSEGEQVIYKLLTQTSKGKLAIADAPAVGTTLSARPHLPNRPANVKVGGTSFGAIDLTASSPTSVAVTWSNRNRTMEEPVLAWTAPSMTPEPGQTTTIRVIARDGTVIATHSGITGDSFAVPVASFGAYFEADVQVVAVRDGLESLQGMVIRARMREPGYGDSYGENYGGGSDGTTPPVTPPTPEPDPVDPVDPGTDFPDPWTPPTRKQLAYDDGNVRYE